MSVTDLFQKELFNLHLTADTEEQVFEQVAADLLKKGYVNDGYLTGIIERESNYPTGLITPNLNVAIPHSDVQFIEKPFIYCARVNTPIKVLQMGDNQEIEVRSLFFLGIKDPKGQAGLLATLMALLSNSAFVEKFKQVDDEHEMYETITQQLKQMEEN